LVISFQDINFNIQVIQLKFLSISACSPTSDRLTPDYSPNYSTTEYRQSLTNRLPNPTIAFRGDCITIRTCRLRFNPVLGFLASATDERARGPAGDCVSIPCWVFWLLRQGGENPARAGINLSPALARHRNFVDRSCTQILKRSTKTAARSGDETKHRRRSVGSHHTAYGLTRAKVPQQIRGLLENQT
jgi:hypothetical protein